MKIVPTIAVGSLCLALFSAQHPQIDSDAQTEHKVKIHQMLKVGQIKYDDLQSRWAKGILEDGPQRYCGTAMGEDIGWAMRPFLEGFYYGYQATGNARWIDHLTYCADAWIRRAVKEPDGYLGWPKLGAAGTNVDHLDDFFADSMLGEAMALEPIVLMSSKIMKTPILAEKYGVKARDYIKVAEQIFDKWNSRGAWRETNSNGMISVELPFGIDRTTGTWTSGYESRYDSSVGFSHQDNKANLIASWLLAMFDVTQKPVYRDRAEKWFRLMKSRMKLKDDGTYRIWNYWEPAGPWDYGLNDLPKHWIGVHPNAGYYDIDVTAMVDAYELGLIFQTDDINRLIATAIADKRYWHALVPYDDTIQRHFEETLDPSSWSGHWSTPWYLALALKEGR